MNDPVSFVALHGAAAASLIVYHACETNALLHEGLYLLRGWVLGCKTKGCASFKQKVRLRNVMRKLDARSILPPGIHRFGVWRTR